MATPDKNNESENLSRIRDILFGEDLQSIEHKLSIFREESDKLLDELKNDFEQKISYLEKVIIAKEKELNTENEKVKEENRKLVLEAKNDISEISKELKSEKAEFQKSLEEKSVQIEKTVVEIEKTLLGSIEKLREDFESKSKSIEENMVTRKTISELFANLSEKLK